MRWQTWIRPVVLVAVLSTAGLSAELAGGGDLMPKLEGAKEYFVAPDGKPDAAGTKEAPLDLVTVLTKPGLVKAGDVVWIAGGTYKPGPSVIVQNKEVCGTRDRPLILRAVRGERATIESQIEVTGNHTWLWGLELTGEHHKGVNLRSGDGVKLINLVLHHNAVPLKPGEGKHPTGQGIGGWDVGNDHEYYGNISYQNGTNSLDHGIYSQNTAEHTVKKYIDNIVFENAGYGFHIYGERPSLAGFYLEGNICFATQRGSNIITGGVKPITNLVLKGNCTYFPADVARTYNVDVGYVAKGSYDIRLEDNYFMGGRYALTVRGVARDLTVRNNTFWGTNGEVEIIWAPDAGKTNVAWDDNTYIANGKFDLAAWRQKTGFDGGSKLVEGREGRPTGLFVFKRVNKYEPGRVHLAVYNWDRKPSVTLDIGDLARPGSKYRVVNVLDFFGKPVAEGTVQDKTIELPMQGHSYEPEFGAYVLFRE